ncbi:BatD family protein [Bacteroidales bacterium OttesenSCG-928-M06]|nr:BatD family protein [Bacteroidales bacterium OttesenSCG-928-M06]
MKKLIFLFLLCITTIFCGLAQNVTFKGSSPRAVVVNQQFRVDYTLITTGERGKDIRLPEVDGLKILFGPTISAQSQSTHFVNGNTTTQQSLTYTYTLLAEKEGDFKLSAATITVGSSEYKSNELEIKVLPPDQATTAANANQRAAEQARQTNSPSGMGSEDVFVRMHVSKSSAFENEGILVTFKLYSLVDVTGFNDAKFPEFEGFIAQEVDLPTNQQMNLENYNGRNYRTIILKQTYLYPQRSGKITIGQGKFDLSIRVRNQNQRSRSFFDDFFDTYTTVRKPLTSPSVTIDVKALPSGKPSFFNGAVGDYKLTSSISTTELKANEPVTVKLTLSGNGNIKMVKNPEIVFPNDFEVYDPKVDVATRVNTSGVTGAKTIEYYAVPRYAGDFTIPKVEFAYFDVKTKTYKTLATEEYHLHVEPGEGGNITAPIIAGTNKEDVRFLGKDIRHVRTDGVKFHKGSYFFGSVGYWLWYIIPAFIFIVLFIVYRKQVKENSDIALMRTKKANKVASKRLKLANKYMKEQKTEVFYEEILKAVWGYLSDKLRIPVSSLTKDNVENELQKYGVSEELINQFMNILHTAEFARFAPSQSQGTMDELYNQTVGAIDKMENTIKKIN